jgi:hypothetical protein
MHIQVGCSTRNSGLFKAFVQSGTLTATFCGHDHYSDAVAYKGGVYLCYGRVSSYHASQGQSSQVLCTLV